VEPGLYLAVLVFLLPDAHCAVMPFLLTLSVISALSTLVSEYDTSKPGVGSKGTEEAEDEQGKGFSGILHL